MGNKHGKLVEKKIILEQNLQLNRQNDELKQYKIKKKSSYGDFKPTTNHHLIVDDAYYNREILSKYLKKIDIKSDQVSNGKEVLELDNLEKYDIIWMDIRMPIMDGFECTMKIREQGYKGIIIGVTGDVSPDNIKKCHEIGMNQVILKPIIYKDFMNSHYVKKCSDPKIIDS